MEKNLLTLYIMKCFSCVICLAVSLLCVSCSVNTTEENSAQMYKEYNEMLYSYEYDHSDTLLFGLYTIDKVRRVYENREELFLKFFIFVKFRFHFMYIIRTIEIKSIKKVSTC